MNSNGKRTKETVKFHWQLVDTHSNKIIFTISMMLTTTTTTSSNYSEKSFSSGILPIYMYIFFLIPIYILSSSAHLFQFPLIRVQIKFLLSTTNHDDNGKWMWMCWCDAEKSSVSNEWWLLWRGELIYQCRAYNRNGIAHFEWKIISKNCIDKLEINKKEHRTDEQVTT